MTVAELPLYWVSIIMCPCFLESERSCAWSLYAGFHTIWCGLRLGHLWMGSCGYAGRGIWVCIAIQVSYCLCHIILVEDEPNKIGDYIFLKYMSGVWFRIVNLQKLLYVRWICYMCLLNLTCASSLLFCSGFWPTALVFLYRVPVLGYFLQQPFITTVRCAEL